MYTLKNNQTEITYRNLEEQVQKNKEDIAKHYAVDRVLAEFGIKVVGQVPTTFDLPDPLTYVGNYGDAYAVGAIEPFNFYIWTRPDPNAGYDSDYWLNIGPLAIIGPEGPKGDTGPTGPKGEATKFYTTTGDPNIYAPSQTPVAGDFALVLSTYPNNGEIYQYENGRWIKKGSIKGPQGIQGIQGIQGVPGPQGPQGPKGETGDVGGSVNIRGILANTSQLPAPAEINNLSAAYLVGAAMPYNLYIQVGTTPNDAQWNNTGAFNAATLVTVNGVGQNVWNADTKLNSYLPTGGPEAYHQSITVTRGDGTQAAVQIANTFTDFVNGNIPRYWPKNLDVSSEPGDGALITCAPTQPGMCANKKYVDDVAATKANTLVSPYPDGTMYSFYSYDGQGNAIRTEIANTIATMGNSAVARYYEATTMVDAKPQGGLYVADPKSKASATNKDYVDTLVANTETALNNNINAFGDSIRVNDFFIEITSNINDDELYLCFNIHTQGIDNGTLPGQSMSSFITWLATYYLPGSKFQVNGYHKGPSGTSVNPILSLSTDGTTLTLNEKILGTATDIATFTYNQQLINSLNITVSYMTP